MIALTKIKNIAVTAASEVEYRRLRACDRASVTIKHGGTSSILEIYGCIGDEKSLAKQAVNYIEEDTMIFLQVSPRLLKRDGKIQRVYTVNDMSEITIF